MTAELDFLKEKFSHPSELKDSLIKVLEKTKTSGGKNKRVRKKETRYFLKLVFLKYQ